MGEKVFGAGDKLKWIEQIVRDLGCTGFDVRVAVEISRRTNTGAGEATVSQTTIANCVGKSPRWVRQSFKKLRSAVMATIHERIPPGRRSSCGPTFNSSRHPARNRNDPSGVEPEHRNDLPVLSPNIGTIIPVLTLNIGRIVQITRKDCAPNIGSYNSSISTTKTQQKTSARARATGVGDPGADGQTASDERASTCSELVWQGRVSGDREWRRHLRTPTGDSVPPTSKGTSRPHAAGMA